MLIKPSNREKKVTSNTENIISDLIKCLLHKKTDQNTTKLIKKEQHKPSPAK
jgi:hypothetical protein